MTPPFSSTLRLDMIKCRRNITYHSKFEFPVYCIMDIPKPYTGVLRCGLYYVEIMNNYPFRGDEWYSQPIVEYGISNNLIEVENIKLEFIPYNTLKNDYFKEDIDTLLKAFEIEPTLQKTAINSLIGTFGITSRTSARTKFSLDHYEASTWWGEKETKSDVFIKNIQLDNGEILYEGTFTEPVEMEATKYPLYKQILEMEAVELHKLETLIIKKGGVVLDRNTDAIRYSSEKEIIINQFWDDKKTIKKYDTEEPRALENETLPRLQRTKILDYEVFNLEWNTQYDYEGTAEEEATRIINSDSSIHITGRAGTGKTTLVNKVIEELIKQGKKYLSFSPTKKGALLIKGKIDGYSSVGAHMLDLNSESVFSSGSQNLKTR